MLEKPAISDDFIKFHLQKEFRFNVQQLDFLPIGADLNTAVYRVTANDISYFLKLRKEFVEITVTIPLFLKSQGVDAIIAPIETKSNRYWADFNDYKMILYPFIEGKNGFDKELSDLNKRNLGEVLKQIHTLEVPLQLKKRIPQETFSPQGREILTSLLKQLEVKAFSEPTAVKLADFMISKRHEITRLIERTEKLAFELHPKSSEFVLCHSDIHGGNILITEQGKLYIVDWDNPILAPKERDLMFIGGGIDSIWKSEREEAIFYDGYGKTQINLSALAYYRYERVIQDLAVIGEQVLLSNEGGADREQSYQWFISNFLPGETIEIAQKTDRRLGE